MARDNNQVMEQSHDDLKTIRRYLLGALSESERQQVEERILSDDTYFLNLQLAEEDLIDEYIENALSKDEQEKFHQRFLSTPERIKSVKFARALRKYIKQHKTDLPVESEGTLLSAPSNSSLLPFLHLNNPVVKWSLLASLLLVIIGISGLLIKVQQKSTPKEPLQAGGTIAQEEQSTQNGQSPAKIEISNVRPIPSPTQADKPIQQESNIAQANRPRSTLSKESQPKNASYSLILTPGMVRGEDEPTLVKIPKNTASVTFKLVLAESSSARHQAILVKGDQEIRSWNRAKIIYSGAGSYVIVTVPVNFLSKGSYYILINKIVANGDLQEINRYYFRIAGN